MKRLGIARALVGLSLAGASAVALATGCGADQSLVGGSCASGYVQCGEKCVDLESDPDNCGACGRSCPLAVDCTSGGCGEERVDAAFDASGDATVDATMGGDMDRTGSDSASPTSGEGGPLQTGDGYVADGLGPESDGANGLASDGLATASPGDGSLGDSPANGGPAADGSLSDSAATSATGDAPSGDVSSESSAANPGGDGSTGSNEADDGAVTEASLGNEPQADGAGTGGEAAGGCPVALYDTPEGCGDCVTVCSGANPVCAPDDGGFACVPACAAPLASCGEECVDTSSDASNCGQCDNVCPSQICENSQCIGTASGGIVFIGHDFEAIATISVTQAHLLWNAVFIPQTNPLRVLIYTHYANQSALGNITDILVREAAALGRTIQIAVTANDADIPATLVLQSYDVFLVPDQPAAPAGALGMLGPASGGNWATALNAFAAKGGVVVVLDGGTGVGEMPAFVTGTGLLTVTAQTSATGIYLDDVARGDVEGVGLVTPYRAGSNSVSVTTEANGGNVVYVIVTPSDAGVPAPVVVHKVF